MNQAELTENLTDLRSDLKPLTRDVVDDSEEILVDIAISSDRYVEALDLAIDMLNNFDPGWFE